MLHLQKEARAGHAPSEALLEGLTGVAREGPGAAGETPVDLPWADYKRGSG